LLRWLACGYVLRVAFRLSLVLWGCAALALAAWRVPYDDEWFSIELAFDATPTQLWAALEGDVHPPWLALLDRGLSQLGQHVLLLQAARVLFSVTAVAIVSRCLARPLGVPRSLFVLAAAHPLVLFYAGAARWYPLLWLAHALRLAALWHARPAGRTGASLFIGGSVLGSLASYLDPLFVLHDALWLGLRSLRGVPVQRTAWPRMALIALAAGGGIVLVRFASPLRAPLHVALHLWQPQWHWREVAAWGLLGLSGEAAFPGFWLALGLGCLGAAAWGAWRALRDEKARPVGLWLLSYAACWLLACGFGIDHPRYSLMLWSIVPVLWLRWLLPTAARTERVLAAVALLHLGLGLGLVVSGRGFFKADLNELEADDCSQLTAAGDVRAVFVTYARIAQLARRRCESTLPFSRVPSIRIVPDETAQLAPLRAVMQSPGNFWLLTVQSEVSYARTAERLHHLLTTRCREQGSRAFSQIPHPGLSAQRGATYRRFRLEQFACP
jgi:hypothetical protein